MKARPSRHGFSLIEALVVLAIGGMALAIIFNIGVKAGDTGFGLGRRAMTAADADVATSDLRSVIRSLALRPQATFLEGVDRPVSGDGVRLEADVIMERATQCAPQGWAGRIVLAIEPRGSGQVLTCSAAGTTAVLIDIARTPAAFSYSTDGETWASTYSNRPSGSQEFEELRAEAVWVRFSAAPVADIVELAASGRPGLWLRPDATL